MPSRSTTLNSSPFWNCWTRILDHESCCEVALCPAQDFFQSIKWIKWHVTSTLLPNPVVLIKGETMWSQSVSKCCCVHLGLDMMRLQAPNYSWMVVTLKMALHGILWKWRRVIFRLIEFSSNCIYFPQPIQLSPINRWTWETPDPTWHT